MSPVPMGDRDTPEKHNDDDNDIESIDSPDFIIAAESSDEDSEGEESPDNQGYQLLPQDPDMAVAEDEEDLPDEPPISHSPNLNVVDQVIVSSMDASDYVGGFGSSMFNLPDVPSGEAEERRDVWNNKEQQEKRSAPLEKEKADEIKAVMAGIKLPLSNHPEWARAVSEDDWKNQLVQQLKPTPPAQRAARRQNKDNKDTPTPSTSATVSNSQSDCADKKS